MRKKVPQFRVLTELIRTANEYLNPDGDPLAYLQRKQLRDRLYGEFPKCFLTLKGVGRETPHLFPLCNRLGTYDASVIKHSIELAKKMNDTGEYDTVEITAIIGKLERLYDRYSKDIPKPANMAARKGYQTRVFNKIKDYLGQVRS